MAESDEVLKNLLVKVKEESEKAGLKLNIKKKTKIMASGAIVLKVLVTHLCSTVYDLMDYGPPGSSIHGILQSRILEWVAIFFSRGIFPTEGSNPGLLRYQQILYCLSHQGSPNFMADRRGKGGKQ